MRTSSPLLINEPPLQVLPSLAMAIGLPEAMVLQQIHYWSTIAGVGIEKDGRRWVYNTIPQWQQQFPFWSERTVRRILLTLKEKGLVDASQLSENSWDHTAYYAIDYDELAKVAAVNGSSVPQRSGQPFRNDAASLSASSLSRDYAENTTETTTERGASPRPTKVKKTKLIEVDEAYLESLVAEFSPQLGEARVRAKLERAQTYTTYRKSPDPRRYLRAWLLEDVAENTGGAGAQPVRGSKAFSGGNRGTRRPGERDHAEVAAGLGF